jgi:hypothetical protein
MFRRIETASFFDDIIVVPLLDATAYHQPSVLGSRSITHQPAAAVKLTTLSFEKPHRTKSSDLEQRFVQELSRSDENTSQPGNQALDVLKTRVFTHILNKLTLHNIPTYGLDQRYLNWCLPRAVNHQLWDRIMEDCIMVTPAELEQVLSLHHVDQVYSSELTGSTRLYVRTFVFEVQELLEILSQLSQERYDYNGKIFQWTERLKNVVPSAVVYIRYAGMSSHDPWKRHLDDLTPMDASSFVLAFIQKTLLTFPEVIKNVIVQEVRDARIEFSVDQSIVNLREQALISLIDSGSLNTEAGGAWQHDPTTEDEQVFATLTTRVTAQVPVSTKACGANKLKQILDLASDIQKYANENPLLTGTNIFSFVQVHCDAIVQGMTPSLIHTNMTPFITMSSDIPLSTFKNPRTFFLEPAVAPHLAATVFNYFGAWEQGLGQFDSSYVSQLVNDHHLPFIDLFPWPKINQAVMGPAMDFVRRYLAIANPLVILSHGELVTSIAIGNLRHSHGLATGDLLNTLGNLHISNHMLPGDQDYDLGYYVVVPSFHPGAIAYRGTASSLTKSIFYMTAMVGWLAYHEALTRTHSTDTKKIICEQIVSAVNTKVGKETTFGKRLEALKTELNRELANRRKERLTTAQKNARLAGARAAAKQLTQERWGESETARPSGQDLYSALKLKFVVYSGARGVIMVTPFSIWAQARKELDVIVKSGFCFSVPESQKRMVEVATIYDKHVAILQNSAESRGDKDAFLKFARSSKVLEGSSYYLSAASVDDAVKDLPNLIRCFLPSIVADPYDARWSRHPTSTMQIAAVEALRVWLKESTLAATDNDEAAALLDARWYEHMKKDPAVFSLLATHTPQGKTQTSMFSADDDLNGTEITIKSHNSNWDATVVKHSFSWLTSNGTLASMDNLPLPRTVMPQTNNDKRFIYFVPEGVDIKDQNRRSIDAYELKGLKQAGKQAGKRSTPVYPTLSIATLVATLVTHPHGKDFLDLWEKQTELKVDEAIESSQLSASSSGEAVIPINYFTANPPRALPVCQEYNANAKKAVRGLLPVYPGDALWLMHEFWTDAYPQGGEVRITNPAEDTSGESVYDKLAIFLRKLLYRQHPFGTSLRALVELSRNGGLDKKKATSTIKSSADVLRGFTKAPTTGTIRVKAAVGGKSMVIGITRFSINAIAPNGVIADVQPPVLTFATAAPTELDILEEVKDEEDGGLEEEHDLATAAELQDMLEDSNKRKREDDWETPPRATNRPRHE